MGKSYQDVLPLLSEDEYSNPGEAFLKTIGHERNAAILKVSLLLFQYLNTSRWQDLKKMHIVHSHPEPNQSVH